MVKIFFSSIILSSLIFSQQILSSISSDNISITESVIYTIKISDFDKNPSIDNISFENFSIIAGPNVGSEYRFINGKKSSSRSISWTLVPQSYGILEIPSFEVKIENKVLKTRSFKINITKQESDQAIKDLFLEVNVSNDNVVVGQEIVLSYTFYTRVASKVLSTEFPEYDDFWVEKLFDPVGIQFTPESWKDIDIEGNNYKSLKLFEVSIFPLEAGSFSLESMIMKVETKNKDSSFNRLFWEDPFFDTFSQRTRAKILVSDPVVINVSSLDNIPENFTGAVGIFNLKSILSESNIDEGSPTVLKVILQGDGNLGNIGRPIINFANDIDIFEGETVIEKNISSNLSGSITWEYNLIPRKNGLYKINSVEIPFFNSLTKSWSTALSKELQLNVNKSTVFDKNDQDILSQKSSVMRYNNFGDQKWISDSSPRIEKGIVYLLTISLILFLLPLFKNSFKLFKQKVLSFISFKSALNNAINNLKNTSSIFEEGPRIITEFFYKKKIIKSVNIDISTLKKGLRKRIQKKDFEILSNFLDSSQKMSYSQLSDSDNDMKNIRVIIKILTKIDKYV